MNFATIKNLIDNAENGKKTAVFHTQTLIAATKGIIHEENIKEYLDTIGYGPSYVTEVHKMINVADQFAKNGIVLGKFVAL